MPVRPPEGQRVDERCCGVPQARQLMAATASHPRSHQAPGTANNALTGQASHPGAANDRGAIAAGSAAEKPRNPPPTTARNRRHHRENPWTTTTMTTAAVSTATVGEGQHTGQGNCQERGFQRGHREHATHGSLPSSIRSDQKTLISMSFDSNSIRELCGRAQESGSSHRRESWSRWKFAPSRPPKEE